MNGFPNWPPNWSTLLFLPALFVGFTVHELAHALVAYLLGDTSQVERKRLSFNPLRHVSWVGLAVFLLLGIGWAKPVWVDPSRFRIKNQALGMFLVSIAGVTANLMAAVLAFVGIVFTMAIVWMTTGAPMEDIFLYLSLPETGSGLQMAAVALGWNMLWVNGLLALWNSLPFPLFDGFQALTSLAALIRGAFKRQDSRQTAAPAAWSAGSGEEATPRPARIHFDIGLEYHRAGQYDEAIARYRQAITHDERFALAYYNQGLAYLHKGRESLAASSFRATLQTSRDVGVRVQADLRLRELARAEQEPELELRPIPPPLEPGSTPAVVEGGPVSLDPEVARRVWLRLSIGGLAALLLAIAAWLFITAVTFNAMM